jgi:hypothetical protein
MRALELKRTVALWSDDCIGEDECVRVCEELLVLLGQALDYGRRLRSGWQLAHAHDNSL